MQYVTSELRFILLNAGSWALDYWICTRQNENWKSWSGLPSISWLCWNGLKHLEWRKIVSSYYFLTLLYGVWFKHLIWCLEHHIITASYRLLTRTPASSQRHFQRARKPRCRGWRRAPPRRSSGSWRCRIRDSRIHGQRSDSPDLPLEVVADLYKTRSTFVNFWYLVLLEL